MYEYTYIYIFGIRYWSECHIAMTRTDDGQEMDRSLQEKDIVRWAIKGVKGNTSLWHRWKIPVEPIGGLSTLWWRGPYSVNRIESQLKKYVHIWRYIYTWEENIRYRERVAAAEGLWVPFQDPPHDGFISLRRFPRRRSRHQGLNMKPTHHWCCLKRIRRREDGGPLKMNWEVSEGCCVMIIQWLQFVTVEEV